MTRCYRWGFLAGVALLLVGSRPGAADGPFLTAQWGPGTPYFFVTTQGDPVASGVGGAVQTSSGGGGVVMPFIYGADGGIAFVMHWEPATMPQASSNSVEVHVG